METFRGALLVVIGVLLFGIGARASTDLVATVSWTAPGGQAGAMLFQGTGDGGVLTGNAFAGNDRLVVSGTIGDDGSISGSLAATDGTAVGNFSASLDAEVALKRLSSAIERYRGRFHAAATLSSSLAQLEVAPLRDW